MSAVEVIPAYAAAGLPVLPLHAMRAGTCTCRRADCHSPAKHPLTAHGKDDATTDLGQIAEWLARWPGCNWGVRPPIGVVVLDVDPRNGGDVELQQLVQRHGDLPPTLTARTGSGGLHHWLSYNGPTRGRLCAGVDIKSSSGYLVAPPSVHACGGTYEWADQRPAAYAPRWVRNLLNPPVPRYSTPRREEGRVEHLVRFVLASAEGERNSRLYWACCRAVENGADVQALIDAAVSIGTPAVEATATARSAQRTPARKVAA